MRFSDSIEGPVLGMQRLALLPREHVQAVLSRAVEQGVRWVDTADVYGARPGDAERLMGTLREALPELRIATKGGLVREGQRWRPDGRARHLLASFEASCERLGQQSIALYHLHAPDPRTPISTSVRALARLHAAGRIEALGLCNVRVGELEAALDELPVASIQVEISPFRPYAVRSGVVELALERGIAVWGYRPLGGVEGVRKLERDPVLGEVAAALGVSVVRLVLAWLRELGVTPLCGPTQLSSVDELAASYALTLPPDAREQLDRHFEVGRLLRRPRPSPPPAPEGRRVLLVMGRPGAGKSSRVLSAEPELRLNRDERGGTLQDLVPHLEAALARGVERVVLDNTYASRASRRPVIEAARAHGVPVHCQWLTTTDDEAEINLVHRILEILGRLPEPEEFDALSRRHPGVIPPRALYRYRQEFEPPSLQEGFAQIEEIPFVRRPGSPCSGKALVLHPSDLVPSQRETLQGYVAQGFLPIVLGWEPAPDEASRALVLDEIYRRGAALGLAVRAWSCPHPDGPPTCWCRRPLPGLLIVALRETGCDPLRSILLGRHPTDRSLARKLGLGLHKDPEASAP